MPKSPYFLAFTALVVFAATPASAVTKCSGKTSPKDGTIEVSATGVVGLLLWGPALGQESNTFSNEATCIANGKAKKCLLGAAGTSDGITPPRNCRIFLEDDVGACEVYLKGCTPGLREETGAGDDGGGGSDSGGADVGALNAVPATQFVNGVETSYTRSLIRYRIEASYDPNFTTPDTANNVVDIPQDVILDYCADEDGCTISLAMRDWSGGGGNAARSIGPLKFYVDPESLNFRVAEFTTSGEFASLGEGSDGDGSFHHALRAANCWLTDATYAMGTNDPIDDTVGFHLLNHNTNPTYTPDCELTLED